MNQELLDKIAFEFFGLMYEQLGTFAKWDVEDEYKKRYETNR